MRKQTIRKIGTTVGLLLCVSFITACDKEATNGTREVVPVQSKIVYKLAESSKNEPDVAELDDVEEYNAKLSTIVYSHMKQEGKEFIETAEFTNHPGQKISVNLQLPEEAKQAFLEPSLSIIASKAKTTVYEVKFTANEAFFKDRPNAEVFYELKWEQLAGDRMYTIISTKSSINTDEIF
ncbi:hypothetical protein [Paenibacillus sp. Marseille-Q4541]|uniref:hypothetical protein n=1 Tax=Paenibacillus sp. Marseille-Q4541 TaxID=2831522 RepID=UPI001BAA0B8D|nr:hypothetical protein [Paenibacillus sp. Marseille-Q4541]